MAKTTTLKERGTGAVIYPQTIPSQVIFPDGTDLNDALESQSNVTGVPTEKRIEAIEPTLVTEALRKVPQSLTPEEQVQVKDNLGISKMELFCDMFNAAAGTDGYARIVDGEFDCKLNKLQLTYEEALNVYLDGPSQNTIGQSFASDNFVMDVEVANLSTLNTSAFFSAYPINIYHKPFGYAKLKKIIGAIDFHFANNKINWFVGAVNLEEVEIRRLAYSIDLSSCGKLNLHSFQTMITRANSDADSKIHPRVITVHPDSYAKLTGDTTNAAAAALTEEELAQWMQIVTDAAAKKITFITA